ncbi:FMN-binding protein [bacterium]|nr:FMN-binding protein [bacterium]
MRRRTPALSLALMLLASVAPAKVFYAKDEALRLAFPDADAIETRDVFLTPEQRAAIEDKAKSKLDSDLLTIYVGERGGARLGYAMLDTHTVRTLPETFLIVLSPQGTVAATHLLAFYEPLEYSPPVRWLQQFHDATLTDDLRIGRGIVAITGSTLTSEAVTGGVRRALAIYDVLLKGK